MGGPDSPPHVVPSSQLSEQTAAIRLCFSGICGAIPRTGDVKSDDDSSKILVARIRVDFNRREGPGTIAISPEDVPTDELKVGALVTLYETGDIECEAILRHGRRWEWVADILDGTIRDSQ